MGAWGGMLDGLRTIAELLVELYSVYAIRRKLTWLFIRFLPSSPQDDENSKRSYSDYKEIKFYEQYGDKSGDPKQMSLFKSISSNFT